ncbi:MAG: hypothetical protein ACRDSE_13950, partial [Pseudonocardiaceae bacterium]
AGHDIRALPRFLLPAPEWIDGGVLRAAAIRGTSSCGGLTALRAGPTLGHIVLRITTAVA